MTEPAEETRHLKTSGSPSGGSSGGEALEHLPVSRGSGGSAAVPVNGDRGRQRELKRRQQLRAERAAAEDVNTDKLWQTKGGQRGVCPASAPAAGNRELTKCPVPAQEGDHPHHHHHQRESSAPASDNLPSHHHQYPGKNGEDGRPQEENSHVDSDTGLDSRLGKKRHRRRTTRKRRNWKPYYKLSWEERKVLEEKETARASRLREEMFAKGLPVAPYNTTQFLMDEHDREEPDLNTETGARRNSGMGPEDTGSEEELPDNHHDEEDEEDGSGGGSDGIGRPGNAGGEFLQRDFSETYEMYHVESLQNMTKQELVQEYLELEKCMSRLEEENNRLRRAAEPGGVTVESSLLRLREMEQELERLRAQNTELLLQNQPSKDRDRAPVATN